MDTNIIMRKANPDEIFDISKTLAKSWKWAYKGLVNDDYLSSLKEDNWVNF